MLLLSNKIQFASAISRRVDTDEATQELIASLRRQLPGGMDLLVLFFSSEHQENAAHLGYQLRRALNPRVLIGCGAESIIGGDQEVEREPAISALAASLPHVVLTPFQVGYVEWEYVLDGDAHYLRKRAGIRRNTVPGDYDETRAFLVLGDPFTTPIDELLRALDLLGDGAPTIGGMASGGDEPGRNVLLLNDQTYDDGIVGIHIAGPIRVDAVVSQGCRAVGETLLVTRAEEQVIYTLGGKPSLVIAQDILSRLSPKEQEQVQNGSLFLGIVTNEYQESFRRGDFLIRTVLGFDPDSGAIVVTDEVRAGQTVQFHIQDANTADEDLRLLLARSVEHDTPPLGALLFTCNGRGLRMFDSPNHDARTVLESMPETPLAGFFAAGEIGPVGGKSHIHGHTASIALFLSSLDA